MPISMPCGSNIHQRTKDVDISRELRFKPSLALYAAFKLDFALYPFRRQARGNHQSKHGITIRRPKRCPYDYSSTTRACLRKMQSQTSEMRSRPTGMFKLRESWRPMPGSPAIRTAACLSPVSPGKSGTCGPHQTLQTRGGTCPALERSRQQVAIPRTIASPFAHRSH